jgi:hypothetical protein
MLGASDTIRLGGNAGSAAKVRLDKLAMRNRVMKNCFIRLINIPDEDFRRKTDNDLSMTIRSFRFYL